MLGGDRIRRGAERSRINFRYIVHPPDWTAWTLFNSHDREQIDVAPQLDWWWQWIRSQAEGVQSVYAFINDDFSGHAPAAANKLKSIIGLATVEPDLPKQMKLF